MSSAQQFTKTVPNASENTSLSIISATSFESTSNPSSSTQSFSVFGDNSCGVPLLAQRLMVDFTPIDDSDSEFIQKKCCAFWKFLSKRPDLQHYMAIPDTDFYADVSESSGYMPTEYVNISEDEKIKPKEKTAVSMLDMFEEKVCSCAKPSLYKSCMNLQSCDGTGRGHSSTEVQHMCRKMQQWDLKHPKSLNPPGHPPALSHCIMQRKVFA